MILFPTFSGDSYLAATAGRGMHDCEGMARVNDFSPSARAVSLISPGSFVDCTMICARPLNRLRCQSGALVPFGRKTSGSCDDEIGRAHV